MRLYHNTIAPYAIGLLILMKRAIDRGEERKGNFPDGTGGTPVCHQASQGRLSAETPSALPYQILAMLGE